VLQTVDDVHKLVHKSMGDLYDLQKEMSEGMSERVSEVQKDLAEAGKTMQYLSDMVDQLRSNAAAPLPKPALDHDMVDALKLTAPQQRLPPLNPADFTFPMPAMEPQTVDRHSTESKYSSI
jgi:hypothetical protein